MGRTWVRFHTIARRRTQRLIPALHRDLEPVDVTAAHLPGEPVPVAEALALPHEPFRSAGRGDGVAAWCPTAVDLALGPFQVVTLRLRLAG